MPQGGAGKCGGNLMSSGNSKKKFSTKPRYTTSTSKATQRGQAAEVPAPAHTVIRPSQEARALVMRAQRAVLEVERKKLAAARRGTPPLNGHRLGRDGSADGQNGAMAVDVRAARLAYLEQQQQQKIKAKAPPVTTVVSPMAGGRARRQAFEAEHGDPLSQEVLLMLDLLDERLQSERAQSEGVQSEGVQGRQSREAVRHAHKTLYTVLSNAAAHGGGDGDPKYRTLRAANERLWTTLLCHPEGCAVLAAAGFEQRPAGQVRGKG